MAVNIVIPEMGESVRTGVVAKWHKKDGDAVKRDEVVMDLETDKITAEIAAPAAGVLKRAVKEGDTVNIGAVVGTVDETATAASPAASGGTGSPLPVASPAKAAMPAAAEPVAAASANGHATGDDVRSTPLAKKLADEHGVDLSRIAGTGPGGRVREQDVLVAVQNRGSVGGGVATAAVAATKPSSGGAGSPPPVSSAATSAPLSGSTRERMSPLRQRIAQRLVDAQHTAAMLTTFNEVDMSAVMAMRGKYKEEFEKKLGVGLGFMSFLVRAVVGALKQFPVVNSYLVQNASGELEIEKHSGAHVAVAVSTPKGLTVPVLRNADTLTFAQIEAGIKTLATKARDGKLGLDDLQGGTFTITNGGVFGSLLSTPILNAPQSAILGMHTIKNRAVENPDKPGEIVLRPMMYLALSYDHRILDGSEAVSFLVAVKNGVERPERMLLGL